MRRTDILERLRAILVASDEKYVSSVQSYTEASDIRNDLGLSSTGMLYLLLALEESFGPIFDDVTIGTFRTIGDLVDFIQERA